MTVLNSRRWFQKSIFSLLGLAMAALPGRAFQIAAELPSAAAAGSPSYGVLNGVTKGPNGQSLLGVQVTVQNVDEKIKRTVLSGSDGNFLIADLKPGQYRLTARRKGSALLRLLPSRSRRIKLPTPTCNSPRRTRPRSPPMTSVTDAGLKTRTRRLPCPNRRWPPNWRP
jgi:hypothetical protein